MFFKTEFVVVFLYALYVTCGSAFVHNLDKCSIKDYECMKRFYRGIIQKFARTGIPEYSIDPIDPFYVRNETFLLLNALDFTFFDGVAEGIKDCEFNEYQMNFEKMRLKIDLTCDVNLKGKYKVYGSFELLQKILGNLTVHGNGKSKVTIKKFNLKTKVPFSVKSKNGEAFIDHDQKSIKTTYVIGNMSFAANNLYFGNAEASSLIMNIMNGNWMEIMNSFGKPIIDRVSEIAVDQISRLFNAVPAKVFFIDDLSHYVT